MRLPLAIARSRLRSSRSLTRDELGAMWRLRLRRLDLEPEVDRVQDFEAFVEDYQHDGLVWLMYEGGEIVSTCLQRVTLLAHDGRRLLALAPE